MLRADLLPFPSFTAALPSANTVASAFPAAAGAAYSPLAHEVGQEVQQFIAQGGGAMGAQSAHAQWLALQALKQTPKSEPATALDGTAEAVSSDGDLQPTQQAFLTRISPWAQQTAQRLGVSVRSVMAHAALESGWGQHALRGAQGEDANNLFGIKATGAWSGAATSALTTEFEAGEPVKKVQPFRQYAALDATFEDYAQLLQRNPRYRAALGTGENVAAFAQALADGGYATDPQYAQKLLRVSRLIPAQP